MRGGWKNFIKNLSFSAKGRKKCFYFCSFWNEFGMNIWFLWDGEFIRFKFLVKVFINLKKVSKFSKNLQKCLQKSKNISDIHPQFNTHHPLISHLPQNFLKWWAFFHKLQWEKAHFLIPFITFNQLKITRVDEFREHSEWEKERKFQFYGNFVWIIKSHLSFSSSKNKSCKKIRENVESSIISILYCIYSFFRCLQNEWNQESQWWWRGADVLCWKHDEEWLLKWNESHFSIEKSIFFGRAEQFYFFFNIKKGFVMLKINFWSPERLKRRTSFPHPPTSPHHFQSHADLNWIWMTFPLSFSLVNCFD